jgi:hypothetical protein
MPRFDSGWIQRSRKLSSPTSDTISSATKIAIAPASKSLNERVRA